MLKTSNTTFLQNSNAKFSIGLLASLHTLSLSQCRHIDLSSLPPSLTDLSLVTYLRFLGDSYTNLQLVVQKLCGDITKSTLAHLPESLTRLTLGGVLLTEQPFTTLPASITGNLNLPLIHSE